MGTRDLEGFRAAGRTLFSLGLVKLSEGNLSTFDGTTLAITRSGAALSGLEQSDVLTGTLDSPPEGASSDLTVHLERYRERGKGAFVHAHPPGAVPEGPPGEHGVYAFGASLEDATRQIVREVRATDRESPIPSPVEWVENKVVILDQSRLPFDEVKVACEDVEQVCDAILRLTVRGAPILGVTAAYAMALAASNSRADNSRALLRDLRLASRQLISARPTAVNVSWAVDRVLSAVAAINDADTIRLVALEEARRIEDEDIRACAAIGANGAALVPNRAQILTHCNTGHLCSAGIGTAQGVIETAHRAKNRIHVWVDETRPVLQGARLTSWELQRLEIPMTLIPDSAAGWLMAQGKVDLVITGADRVAANGDAANKIGTYALAVLADHHGIPFFIAAPLSTVDARTPTGDHIRIEERLPSEVLAPMGVQIAGEGTPAFNPAFDVTPGSLITGIITEVGVASAPYKQSLRRLVRERRSA